MAVGQRERERERRRLKHGEGAYVGDNQISSAGVSAYVALVTGPWHS
jgi:hypothetical protein